MALENLRSEELWQWCESLEDVMNAIRETRISLQDHPEIETTANLGTMRHDLRRLMEFADKLRARRLLDVRAVRFDAKDRDQ